VQVQPAVPLEVLDAQAAASRDAGQKADGPNGQELAGGTLGGARTGAGAGGGLSMRCAPNVRRPWAPQVSTEALQQACSSAKFPAR